MAQPQDQIQDADTTGSKQRPRHRRRVLVLLAVLVLLVFVMAEVINPFGSNEYLPIGHGDHYHYVPENRNTDVPISEFPTEEPRSNERITPDGRVVPAE